MDIVADMPLIHADCTAMRLMLDNLIDNAVHFPDHAVAEGVGTPAGRSRRARRV